jgi:mono/diheme cytochrome c family protein
MTYLFRSSYRAVFHWLFAVLCWSIPAGPANAIELPVPEKLERQFAVKRQTVEVVEPHDSTPDRPHVVRYQALAMEELLSRWFMDRWKTRDAEIVLLARDGYRSTIPGGRFLEHRAYLAFGRDDGGPFNVNNLQQHEQGIPLGPYYLIWDNRNSGELQRQGAYGWPYQVTRIDLHSPSDDRRLLPADADPTAEKGFSEAREYCLTCHHIRGIGGTKYPVDLVQASCRWKEDDLKAWLADPGRIRPGTAMPPLNPRLPDSERVRVIDDIGAFLGVLRRDVPGGCIGPDSGIR